MNSDDSSKYIFDNVIDNVVTFLEGTFSITPTVREQLLFQIRQARDRHLPLFFIPIREMAKQFRDLTKVKKCSSSIFDGSN